MNDFKGMNTGKVDKCDEEFLANVVRCRDDQINEKLHKLPLNGRTGVFYEKCFTMIAP